MQIDEENISIQEDHTSHQNTIDENISQNTQQDTESTLEINTLIVNELITSQEESTEVVIEESTEVPDGGPFGSVGNEEIHKDLQLIIFLFLFFIIYYILRSVRNNFIRIGL